MSDARAPKGSEWNDVIDVLHRFANVMTTRAHYPDGHPAIPRAVGFAAEGFQRLLEHVPELVITVSEGEFVICGRPMPDLREHLAGLMTAMERHHIDCIVFQRGLEAGECERLGKALALGSDANAHVRETAQAELVHVLLRFAEIRTHDSAHTDGVEIASFVPAVQRVLDHVVNAFAQEQLADVKGIRAVAQTIVSACARRSYRLLPRCYAPGADDQAAHASNVAMMTASLALAGQVADALVVDVTAAAMLHDIGILLSSGAARGIPEPALDDDQHRRAFRNHPVAGAWALLSAGCPALWVAVALEHHRGVDGGGYPALPPRAPPHELVRLVALASFVDRKRTLLAGRIDDPEEVLRQALHLEGTFFGPPLVTRFLRTFGVHPPGTVVELSNRQTALVTHASPHDPLRPEVQLLSGPKAGQRVDLKQRNTIEGRHELSISRAILAPLALLAPDE